MNNLKNLAPGFPLNREGCPDMHEMRRISRIHFIGIGGAGMCGLAQVLKNQGYFVSGSDTGVSGNTRFLQELGITIYPHHEGENVLQADVVVVSSAIAPDNMEIITAVQHRIPVISRAEMLAELMRYRHGIAVAGTHGKTTTTSIIATVLGEAGLDPTFIIGGMLNAAGSNARLGESRILVAEADESDASFLHLQPMVAIITNIEPDHMSTYNGNIEKLHDTFISFLHNLPFYGLAIVCIDDPVIRCLLPRIKRHIITYGQSEDADVRAVNIAQQGQRTRFDIIQKTTEKNAQKINSQPLPVSINLPGRHNVLNSLAAFVAAREEGVSENSITRGLQSFEGVSRRFEAHGTFSIPAGEIFFVDDYGHHPSEVSATVEAIRQGWPDRRLVMVFQPHRYSRTRDLYEDFVDILARVDVLLLLNIYAAGECPIPGIDSRTLCRSVRQRGKVDPIFVSKTEEVEALLRDILQDNDLLITQGAGSIGQLAKDLSRNLSGVTTTRCEI